MDTVNIPLTFTDTSVRIHAVSVYRCPRCGQMCQGWQVAKQIHDGLRHCPVCRVFVMEDITGTADAVEYLEWRASV